MQPLETPTQGGATKRQAECPPPSYQAQFRHDPPGMSDQARGVGDSHPARYVWLALSSHVHERDWEGGVTVCIGGHGPLARASSLVSTKQSMGLHSQ